MGKPGRGHALSSWDERIVPVKRTRGSEPSQYPEEEKAIAIPSVAASERGTSLNLIGVKHTSVAYGGLRGIVWSVCVQAGELQIICLAEVSGKKHQRG